MKTQESILQYQSLGPITLLWSSKTYSRLQTDFTTRGSTDRPSSKWLSPSFLPSSWQSFPDNYSAMSHQKTTEVSLSITVFPYQHLFLLFEVRSSWWGPRAVWCPAGWACWSPCAGWPCAQRWLAWKPSSLSSAFWGWETSNLTWGK